MYLKEHLVEIKVLPIERSNDNQLMLKVTETAIEGKKEGDRTDSEKKEASKLMLVQMRSRGG